MADSILLSDAISKITPGRESRVIGSGRHSETLEWFGLWLAPSGQLSIDELAVEESSGELDRIVLFSPTHRHYKGGLYEGLGIAEHPRRGRFVAYRHADFSVWFRPLEMFVGNLPDGRQRFASL